MGAINAGSIMGIVAGAALAAFIDKPMSGMISNPTMRGAIKAGLGVFLNGKTGIMQSVGAGMIAAGGIQVLGAMMPGSFGADVPALISGDELDMLSSDVPALISDEFGYSADEIGDEFDDEFSDEFGDEFGEDLDDMGEDMDDMAEDIMYSNELAGIEGV
jgi:hypothetical protein